MLNGGNKLHEFGSFRLDLRNKFLWHNDELVDLPLKALEVLCVLTERRGEVVSKQAIWEQVWQDTYVEETNLTHTVYLIRQAFKRLGEESLIQTVPRRGYRFIAETREVDADEIILEKHTRTQTVIELQDGDGSPRTGTRVFSSYRIAAALVVLSVAVAGLAVWRAKNTNASNAAIRSVAVLPLRSFDDGNEELRLRITDALITRLGNLTEVSVRPTNSVLGFAKEDVDTREAGERLEVDAVLNGRMQVEGDRVRVTLQLVSTANGEQAWAGQFDGRADDILGLQDAIAATLVPELRGEKSSSGNPTTSAEAYENYLKGRYLWNKRRNNELKKAVPYFEQAIALDPKFALAYAGLADTYSQLANDGPTPDFELYSRAKETANKALEIDPGLSEGYAALGWIAYIHEWNWTEAERNLARAIELNPGNADAHHWRGLNFKVLGDNDQFAAEMETARRLSPLTKAIGRNYSDVVRQKKGCDGALDYIERLIALQEIVEGERAEMLSHHHAICGNYDAVLAARGVDTAQGLKVSAYVGIAHARLGQHAQARQILERFEKVDSTAKFYLRPYIYVALGDFDSALADLEKGIAARDNRFIRMGYDEFLAPLRTDPRFDALLAKLKPIE